mgnify:FL=1
MPKPTPRQLSVVLKFSTEMQLKNKISLVLLVSWIGFILNLCLYGLAAAQSKDAPSCNVMDFKMLALTTNDEQVREKNMNEWLIKFGKACASDEIIYIRANLSAWLGTANTLKINQSIENILTEKKNVQKNYNADTSELEKNKNNASAAKPQTDAISTRR